MTGSALIDFVITLVVLFGAGALFFVAIDRMSPDAFMNKIAKIAVGVVLTVVFLLAIRGLLFGGASAVAISGGGIIGFAIGLIVILVLLFLVDKALQFFAAYVSGVLAEIIRYVVFAVALIALLVLVDRMFFSGQYTGKMFGDLPQIMKSEKR
jgi:hypothetical protein